MGRRGRPRLAAALIVTIVLAVSYLFRLFRSSSEEECALSFGQYVGPKYVTDQTEASKCLVQNQWMRLMQHSVRLGGTTSSMIGDWLFIDYHDRVNVLVEDESENRDDVAVKRFLVLRQRKYALDGIQSLAAVGGIIKPGEEATNAARREVQEEMGMVCDSLVPLGRYRTGARWVNSFVARDCRRDAEAAGINWALGRGAVDEVGAAETERKDQLSLTVDELRDAARGGRFVEVQWSNTVALALLHE